MATRTLTDAEKAANAAKRAEAKREDTAPADVKLPKPSSMAKPLGLIVSQLNGVLQLLPQTRADALDQDEAEALVAGLDDAQMASPKFRRWLKSGTEGAGFLSLGLAVFGIAFTRAARHGWIPGIDASNLSPEDRERMTADIRASMAEMWKEQQANGAAPAEWNPPPESATIAPVYTPAGF